MQLNGNDWTVRWFRWCLRNLPFAPMVHSNYDSTSLCTFVWTALWLPLIELFVMGVFLYFFGSTTLRVYNNHGWFGVLLPIAVLVAFAALLVAIIWLMYLMDRSITRSRVLDIAGSYIKSIKDRVCPLVKIKDQ